MAAQEDNLFALLGEEEDDVSNLIERIKKEKDEIKESRKEKVPKEKNQHVIEVEARPLDMRAKRIILPKHVMRSFIVLDKKKQREEEEARAKASAAASSSEAKPASTEVSAAAAGSEAKSASTEVSAAASGSEAKSSKSNNGDLQGGYRSNYRTGNGYRRGPRKNKSNGNTTGGKFVTGGDGFMHRVRNGSIPTDSVDEKKKEANTNGVVEKDSGKSVDGKLIGPETFEEYQRRMEFERRKKEREEDAKLMTFKQYEEKQQREKAKLAKIAEQRRVDEKAFESMKIVGKKKEDFEKKSENKPKKEDNGRKKKINFEEALFRWPSNRSYNNGPNRNHYGSSTRPPFVGRNYDERNKEKLNDRPNEANQQQQKLDNDRPNGERKDSRRSVGDERNNYRQNHYGQRNNYYQQNGGGAPVRPPLPPKLEDSALFPAL